MHKDRSKSKKIRFDILTLFPSLVAPYFEDSILMRAQKAKLIDVRVHDLRDFTTDKHRTTDDAPYGGGPGMVMKVEPIFKAVAALKKSKVQSPKSKVILLSPRGKQFNQDMAARYSTLKRLILICGRYEGVDQRVADHISDEEISVGPYVLSGGEIAALAVIEAMARLIPGVLGNSESNKDPGWPQFTRPAVFTPQRGVAWRVPKVLVSGNHSKIVKWRSKKVEDNKT